jgi:catechol 2,3-dioxygenase-like lactoylglutathione lyase family enzyme
MQATKVMANLRVADIEAAKSFYADYLGGSETRLRDRASIEYRGMGPAPVLRPGPGRQRDQHREPPRLKLRPARSLKTEIASRAA